jgi:hypothetical protein
MRANIRQCPIHPFPHTHKRARLLKYGRLISFPRQQWLCECASMLRHTYIACLLLNLSTHGTSYCCSPVSWQTSENVIHIRDVNPPPWSDECNKRKVFWYMSLKCSTVMIYARTLNGEPSCYITQRNAGRSGHNLWPRNVAALKSEDLSSTTVRRHDYGIFGG